MIANASVWASRQRRACHRRANRHAAGTRRSAAARAALSSFAASLRTLTYYGRGPEENYNDRQLRLSARPLRVHRRRRIRAVRAAAGARQPHRRALVCARRRRERVSCADRSIRRIFRQPVRLPISMPRGTPPTSRLGTRSTCSLDYQNRGVGTGRLRPGYAAALSIRAGTHTFAWRLAAFDAAIGDRPSSRA